MKHEQVKCNQQYTQLRMQNILSITFLDSLLFSVSFAASFSHFVLVASVLNSSAFTGMNEEYKKRAAQIKRENRTQTTMYGTIKSIEP